ncbi:hypothetical protein ABMY26_18315 [Azospirillum sp. HJ39]|uniref:hypothetical protein n=1 Tax=Azospirillum sp. HJ39 TaxID=3159496 RepID=UPI0035586C13
MRNLVRSVAGAPYPAVRTGWPVGLPEESSRRRGTVGLLAALAGPVLGATVLGALILHLMAGLAARLPVSDALGAVSIVAGMTVVLVTLLPFALLWVRRAQRVWADVQDALQDDARR